ncbi:helix-turn-helix transcriptional regulator [Photobacterium atrarenae]|uniref:AlpA family phage regulatory protein n=1 Tax=Photobacterium atrarenae TaxID=865757 RepID=A0ABY5GHP9_9GAMM|nr:AlpA family phage regulatory protein [Photobacterium atrarenae]UTV27883.1 AlpA family phage regulatory protein [Photobacterium atrarenae]
MMTSLPQQDRFIREPERLKLTTISRTQAWKLEKQGLFPKRIRLGSRSVAWRLSEISDWLNSQQQVESHD